MIHVMHNLFGIRIGELLRIKAYPHWYCASTKRLFATVHKRSNSIAAPKLGGSLKYGRRESERRHLWLLCL